MAALNFPDAPVTNQAFQNWTWDGMKWIPTPAASTGIPDAPTDNTTYGRNQQTWVHLTHSDITDWATSISQPATVAPLMDNVAAIGTSLLYARQDHVHASDTSRYAASNPSGYQTAAQVASSLAPYAPLASPTFTGTVTIPAGASIAGYALSSSVPAVATTTPVMDGTAAIGTAGNYATANHVHPTDTTRAPLASPTFTGTPAAPTVSPSTDNSTKLATTAFVQSVAAGGGPAKPSLLKTVAGPVGGGTVGTPAMAQLNCQLTPTTSGRVLVTFCGYFATTTTVAGAGMFFQMYYGTGTPPGAVSGTAVGGQQAKILQTTLSATTYFREPFSISWLFTGLTLNTAYWFDLWMNPQNTQGINMNNVQCVICEV